MKAQHPCGLCGSKYYNRGVALICCGGVLADDIQTDDQPQIVTDGGHDGSITVARDDRRISALVDGEGFAVLATTAGGNATAADVRAALREADGVLKRLDETESLDELDPLPDGEQRTGVTVRE